MGVQRALAAILFTDAVGFSNWANRDEESALRNLENDFSVMRASCLQHEGQVLKNLGDGLLMVFGSAVQAVNCALDIQQKLGPDFGDSATSIVKSLTDTPLEHRTLEHRIGIHLGDVLLSEDDAQGDGVNIASRLQSGAPPGGIWISSTVYDVVKNRLHVSAVSRGMQTLKNIAGPVQVYEIGATIDPKNPKRLNPFAGAKKQNTGTNPMPLAIVFLGVAILAAGMMVSNSNGQMAKASEQRFLAGGNSGPAEIVRFVPILGSESSRSGQRSSLPIATVKQNLIEGIVKSSQRGTEHPAASRTPASAHRAPTATDSPKTWVVQPPTPPDLGAPKPNAAPGLPEETDENGPENVTLEGLGPEFDQAMKEMGGSKKAFAPFVRSALEGALNEASLVPQELKAQYRFSEIVSSLRTITVKTATVQRLIAKYEGLELFKRMFLNQIRTFRSSHPLSVPGIGFGASASVWSAGGDQLKIDDGQGDVTTKALADLTPDQIEAIFAAMMPNINRKQEATRLVQLFTRAYR